MKAAPVVHYEAYNRVLGEVRAETKFNKSGIFDEAFKLKSVDRIKKEACYSAEWELFQLDHGISGNPGGKVELNPLTVESPKR